MTWYVWGVNSDVPVPADYDGDGRADIAVGGRQPEPGIHKFVGLKHPCSPIWRNRDIPIPAAFIS